MVLTSWLLKMVHRIFAYFNVAALVTTERELADIEAAAMIGLRRPTAAIGIAPVL